MEQIDFRHYKQFIYELELQNRRIITNCYLSDEDIKSLLDKSISIGGYVPSVCLFVFIPEKEYYRLYYFLTSIGDIYFLSIPNACKIVSCSVIIGSGKKSLEKDVLEAFIKKKFMKIGEWNRWGGRIEHNISCKKREYQIEEEWDNSVWEVVNSVFGETEGYAFRIPLQEEVENYACNHRIIRMRHNNCNVAFLIYRVVGRTVECEYVYVCEKERGSGLSKVLINCIFEKYKGYYYYAWVRTDNYVSVALHLSVGLKQEKYTNITYVKKMEEANERKSVECFRKY